MLILYWLCPLTRHSCWDISKIFINLEKHPSWIKKYAPNSALVSSEYLSLFHLHIKRQKNSIARCTIDFIPFKMAFCSALCSCEVSDGEPYSVGQKTWDTYLIAHHSASSAVHSRLSLMWSSVCLYLILFFCLLSSCLLVISLSFHSFS